MLAVRGQVQGGQNADDLPQDQKPPQLRIKRDIQPDKRNLCQQQQRNKGSAEEQLFQPS